MKDKLLIFLFGSALTVTLCLHYYFDYLRSHESSAEYSQLTKDKTMELIKAAAVVQSGVENGINYQDYKAAIQNYSTALSMYKTFAPDDINYISYDLDKAEKSWYATLKFWDFKLNPDLRPAELYTDPPKLWRDACRYILWHGKRYPIKDSFGATMAVGGIYFDEAKPTLLKILK